MNALLAIKPEFAEKILAGEKKYEFRRTIFRDTTEIGVIYLYASSPCKQIVGLFRSKRMAEASPEELWELFGEESGIEERERFMGYFEGVDTGYAIEVNDTHRIQPPLNPNRLFEDFTPPVSFNYLSENQDRILRQHMPNPLWNQTESTELTRYTSD